MRDSLTRDYTKFFTYPETAQFMAGLLNPQPFDVVLEPHAGNGALVKAVLNRCPESLVFACEIQERWKEPLKSIKRAIVVIKDFLAFPESPKCTSCIANPPFGNDTDLQAHFNKIINCVKQNGRIVLLLPESFEIPFEHEHYPLENWSTNKDGSKTPIKVVSFLNPIQ